MGMRYRWFDKEENHVDEYGLRKSRAEWDREDDGQKPRRIFSHGEITGMVLASVLLLYSLFAGDIPMLFFALSFLIFMGRRLTALMEERKGTALGNLLKGFSIALFFGAIVMAIF